MNDEYETTLTHLLDSFDASESVREIARALAHRAFAKELHEQQPLEQVVVCAVYIAFQCETSEYRFRDITSTTTFDRISIARTYRLLADELNLDLGPADPHESVNRYATSLDVKEETEAWAHEIVNESVDAGLHSGIAPAGLAAGALYLAGHTYPDRAQHTREHIAPRLNQSEIADVAGVTATTVRHRYAEQAYLLEIDGHGKIPAGRRHLFDEE